MIVEYLDLTDVNLHGRGSALSIRRHFRQFYHLLNKRNKVIYASSLSTKITLKTVASLDVQQQDCSGDTTKVVI